MIVTRERSNGKGSTYGPGPYFLSKLAAELPVTALFPCLFGAIMYPLAGLQMKSDKFLKFLGILIVETFAAAGFGMFVGTLVPSVDAGLAVAPALMVLFIIMGGYYVNQKSVPLALQWIQEVRINHPPTQSTHPPKAPTHLPNHPPTHPPRSPSSSMPLKPFASTNSKA